MNATTTESANQFNASRMWKKLSEEPFSGEKSIDLDRFRMPGSINSRLASWDPYDESSYRYYKNILFNLAMSMDEEFFELYRKVGNTDLGNPIYVDINGCRVNLDYMFSIQEIIFCKDVLPKVDNVVEIGAGFGRTCHAIVKNFPELTAYTIIDIPEVINLSRKYLSKVLAEHEFKKVVFLDNSQALSSGDGLYINIDSFQEMDAEVANNYLSLIDEKGDYFYSRNTICKYHPDMIGARNYDKQDLLNATAVGLCQNIVDIFNPVELGSARSNYLRKFSPSSRWEIIKQDVSLPWQYYHHVLYNKS